MYEWLFCYFTRRIKFNMDRLKTGINEKKTE